MAQVTAKKKNTLSAWIDPELIINWGQIKFIFCKRNDSNLPLTLLPDPFARGSFQYGQRHHPDKFFNRPVVLEVVGDPQVVFHPWSCVPGIGVVVDGDMPGAG